MTMDDRGVAQLEAPVLIGATIYQAYKLHQLGRLKFDLSVIDEAGQMPIAHCMPALLNASSYVIAGDHKQLPPILKNASAHPEFLKRSLYEHLHYHYSEAAITLDVTFRMNSGINEFPSQAFYANVLRPSACAAKRFFKPKDTELGELAHIIGRDECVTFVELDHRSANQRAPSEADLVARLAAELLLHHELAPQELAIVSPHRAHNEAIRTQLITNLGHDPRVQSRVRDRLVIDTVERLQGQERDVIIFSLCASDRQSSINKSQFLYSPNRLNVAITRSRKRLFAVGSKYFFPHINGILIDARHLQLWESYYDYLVGNNCRVVHKVAERSAGTDHRSAQL
jgi:DNA replication ATP-dependent helicase Dna2